MISADLVTTVWLGALTLYMVGIRGRVLRLERRRADELKTLNDMIAEMERARWALNTDIAALIRRIGTEGP